jgi:hypothetical protein
MAAKERAALGVNVELLIFSGRPDPTWTVEGLAVEETTRRVRAALAGTSIHAPPEGGLGYRGFRLTGLQGEFPQELEVFRGVISERARGGGRHWLDAGGLEEFLLEMARQRGFASVLASGGAPRGGATGTTI